MSFVINFGKQIQTWIDSAPDWAAATLCQERIARFYERIKLSPKSPHAPLVVAMLGGTGTGKSTLLNALLGEKIVTEGKERPTTNEPVLVCHTYAEVSRFGQLRIERRENVHLEQMMILDCPDPDTTDINDTADVNSGGGTENDFSESKAVEMQANSNLQKLRRVLPFCDIILVTGTQQKYRSRRVLDELAAAAPGARLIFVQTHADRDADVREDWQQTLQDGYETGEMFFVNSLKPDEVGNALQGLRQLLTSDLNEEAAIRIRQANFFGLAESAITDCQKIVEEDWQPVNKLRDRISEERQRFAEQITAKIRSELIRDRRNWEAKVTERISAQWGYSPFSLLLRIYQGLGYLMSGALLTRVRSPIQLALWGSFETVRRLQNRRIHKATAMPEFSLEESTQLKESALILTGFATDAQIKPEHCQPSVIQSESIETNETLLSEIGAELETLTDKLAQRGQRLWYRLFYEILFGTMLLFLVFRLAKNFFYDSAFFGLPELGLEQYLISFFWLFAWGALLLFFFTMSLRRGIESSIKKASRDWYRLPALDHLFESLENETTKILSFRDELNSLKERMDRINQQAKKLDQRLGKNITGGADKRN